jgi:nicotinate-nucleotide adenylyltransferase
MNVVFFGGSFDPPHVAHVLCVSYALAVGDFERALVVPVFEHAFGKSLGDFEHRARLCELAFDGDARVEVSRVEAELPRPNYTLRTIEHLRSSRPELRLRLLMGSDVIGDTSKWFRFDQVEKLAPPFVVPRAGVQGAGTAFGLLPELSSTEVRDLLARRRDPEVHEQLSRVLPRRVLAYIDEHGLYLGAAGAVAGGEGRK